MQVFYTEMFESDPNFIHECRKLLRIRKKMKDSDPRAARNVQTS